MLCEAAEFHAVLVETVGVGPAEAAVAEMVDMFVLVLPPAAGGELQRIKHGVADLADLALVNKADGELAAAARCSVADYASARLIRPPLPEWRIPVPAVSALKGIGGAEVCKAPSPPAEGRLGTRSRSISTRRLVEADRSNIARS